jgi:LPXTG-motif cell wall-anchored protein
VGTPTTEATGATTPSDTDLTDLPLTGRSSAELLLVAIGALAVGIGVVRISRVITRKQN